MAVLSEIERDTDTGRKFLASSSLTKEELMQKVAAEPLSEKQRRTFWLNMAAVEAITPISPEGPVSEQDGGEKPGDRPEPK